MQLYAIPFLLAVGGLLAVQAAANVQLSAAVGSPAGGATVQLGVGAAVLLIAALAAGSLAALGRLGDVAAWHLVGGLGSALYILAGILLFPRLGAIVTVGLFIAGQMVASLVLDDAGWLGVAREPIGPAAGLGTVAVVAGAVVIVRAQAGSTLEDAMAGRPGWLGLAVAAGAVLPVQGAVNAQLRGDLDAPLAAALWSFVVACAAMAAVLSVLMAPDARRRPGSPAALGCPGGAGWVGCAARST